MTAFPLRRLITFKQHCVDRRQDRNEGLDKQMVRVEQLLSEPANTRHCWVLWKEKDYIC